MATQAAQGADKAPHLEEGLKLFQPEKSFSSLALPQNQKIIGCVIGALIVIGGLFLLLAAANILPHGLNAVSQLGVGGYVLGGLISAIGIAALALSLIKSPILSIPVPSSVLIKQLFKDLPTEDRPTIEQLSSHETLKKWLILLRTDKHNLATDAIGVPSKSGERQWCYRIRDQISEILTRLEEEHLEKAVDDRTAQR